jgi:hypothetical protein
MYFSTMRTILLFVSFITCVNIVQAMQHKKFHTKPKLLALYDSSDSGTSMTLEKANKNAEAAKNNRSRFFPIFFSPLLIVFIVIAAKRRKKRQEEEKNKK